MMCTTCGCGQDETHIDGKPHEHDHGHTHAHDFGHGLKAAHAPGLGQNRILRIEQDILGRNNRDAASNRRRFAQHGMLVLNLVSSPGSGKTTLLTRTLDELHDEISLAVIEGDQQTALDAERVRATGVSAVQINTGKGCHLDAHMVGHALDSLPAMDDGILFIENVGNLVCPAAFDLGEAHKVVILSVTEGEDKPLKYPDMFHAADLMLLNKTDLLPYVDFDIDQCIAHARRVNPDIAVLRVSATTGQGLPAWFDWLRANREAILKPPPQAAEA
jgi:hydrogenase nickel incorporation protein HypB